MKQRTFALILALCLLTGCTRDNPAADPVPKSGQSSPDADSTGLQSLEASADPRGESIERALELLAARELTRPVDEAFLAWGCEAVSPDFADVLTEGLPGIDPQREPFFELFGQTLHLLWDRYTGALGSDSNLRDTGADGPVTLAFGGDVNLADDWENMLVYRERGGGVEGVIAEVVLERMRAADILMVNNEFCFSDRGEAMAGKLYTFRAATENVEMLREMGVDIVSLANNHVYDYGETAFLDTLDTLTAAGIPYVGGGRNRDEAVQAQYFHAGGMKIAYLAASRAEKYVVTPEAAADSPGILWCYEEEALLEAVAVARENADWVVVFLHWGTEHETALEPEQVSLAHNLVDAGADIVVGAHPHLLQGLEVYRDRPIAYSLGNFWFNVGWIDTVLLEVELTAPGEYEMRVLPCLQAGGTLLLYEEESDRLALFRRLERLSENVEIDGDGRVRSVSAGEGAEP